jgi:hypothetical protein
MSIMKTGKLVTSIFAIVTIAAVAGAQSLSPGDPKYLNEIDTAADMLGSATVVNDVAVDSLGNRIAVGSSTSLLGTQGFVTVTNKRGLFVAHAAIPLGVGKAVACDGTNAYVLVNAGGAAHVLKYQFAAGGSGVADLLWTEDAPANTVGNDLVMMGGDPVSVGSNNGFVGIQIFKGDGTGFNKVMNPTTTSTPQPISGALNAAALAPNGSLYFTGNVFQASNRCAIGMMSSNFGAAVYLVDGADGVMNDIKVDPTTGMAISGGYVKTGGTAKLHRPFLELARGTYDSATNKITFLKANTLPYNYDSVGGADLQAVETAPNGQIYFLISTLGNTTQARYFELLAYKKVAGGGIALAALLWHDILPVDPLETSDLVGLDVIATSSSPGAGDLSNVSVLAVNEKPATSSEGNYRAYNLFTWSATGERLDARILGSVDQPAASSYDSELWPINTVVYTDIGNTGTLSFFAPTIGDQAGFWGAGFTNGPDDYFKTNEDISVSGVMNKKKLLDNDLNGFNMGLTVALDSAPVEHLSSVTVNPDGTWSAVPELNYNGTAAFYYDVLDGVAVIGTHKVTIEVHKKNDAPVAEDDEYAIDLNSPEVPLDVLANDSDVDGDPIRISAKTLPSHGVVRFSADHLSLTYKPAHNYSGDDSFTYTIRDSHGVTSVATVTLHVINAS